MTGWPVLSLSLAGLIDPDDSPGDRLRVLAGRASALGFGAVHLDATFSSFRPRDLDRSARKEIGAVLRSASLACSGVDLFIPDNHFRDPDRMERALAAAHGALELAADLARFACSAATSRSVVSTRLHANTPAEVIASLDQRGHDLSAAAADHAWPLNAWVDPALGIGAGGRGAEGGDAGVAAGVNAAALLGMGADPAAAATAIGKRLASVRLAPACFAGGTSGSSAAGRLDPLAFAVALMTAGYAGLVVVDPATAPTRGMIESAFKDREHWEAGARLVLDAWTPPTAE